jgi:urease accessory protein
MQPASSESRRVFDANRAAGHVAFSVEVGDGRTRRRSVHERGPLRVRFPNADPVALEAILMNTAGGIAGGDALTVEIAVGEHARLVAGTAAAEKVYRSHGPDAQLSLTLRIAAGARLHWLPQETILFDRARLTRHIEVDLAADASLVLAEALVFGRAAMGETVETGAIVDHWRVRQDGRLVFAESTRLTGAVMDRLRKPVVANGGCGLATVLIAPGTDDCLERVRACADLAGQVGISAWNGIAVARLCAPDGAALRRDLINLLAALNVALPRLWLQ